MKEKEELKTLVTFITQFINDHKPPKVSDDGNSLLPHRVPATLPAAYVNKILKDDSHLCKCTKCNPEYTRQLEKDVHARLAKDFEKTTRYELMEETVKAIRESVTEDAEQTIRKEIREEVLKEEILKRKEKLQEEIDVEYRSKVYQESGSQGQGGVPQATGP